MDRNCSRLNERQKGILNASLQILQNEAYTNLTIRNISEKIGLSEAAIYKHFDSKEELVRTLVEWIVKENEASLNFSEEANEFDILEAVMKNTFTILEVHPSFTAVLFHDELFREYSSVKDLFDTHRKKKEQFLTTIVERGIKKGIFSKDINPQVFVSLYMGAVRITVLNWRYKNFSFSLTDQADPLLQELFKLLKRGDK